MPSNPDPIFIPFFKCRFVLKLVIVVLTRIGLSTEKDDVIFIFSMFTSFGALIYFGLQASASVHPDFGTDPKYDLDPPLKKVIYVDTKVPEPFWQDLFTTE